MLVSGRSRTFDGGVRVWVSGLVNTANGFLGYCIGCGNVMVRDPKIRGGMNGFCRYPRAPAALCGDGMYLEGHFVWLVCGGG